MVVPAMLRQRCSSQGVTREDNLVRGTAAAQAAQINTVRGALPLPPSPMP
jgi:hypothetical protein